MKPEAYMETPPLEKTAFVVSLAFLAFVYGIATHAFGWFPSSVARQAWNQLESASPLSTRALAGSRSPQWSAPRVYDREGVRHVRPALGEPGLTLLTSAWDASEGGTPGVRLIDREGEVVHRWVVDPEEIFSDTVASPRGPLGTQDVQGTYLFPNGDLLVNVEYVGVARLDACGRVRWRNSAHSQHHSIARSDDGTFWIPGVERDMAARSARFPDGYPGLEGPIHHDLILEMDGSGEILRRINVLDVLYENDLERFIPHARLDASEAAPFGRDVTHLNDIEPLSDSLAGEYPLFEAGDVAVSLRHQHLVFVLDPDSREVKWHAHRPFIHQHDPDFLGDGWIGVLDNNQDGTGRGTMLGGSRIVTLQPHTDSLKVIFPTPLSEGFYTRIRGKWQALTGGNLLLTEAQTGRVVEVAPDGRTVWEWVHAPSGESTVPSVTAGTRVDLTESDLSSWPCSAFDATPDDEERRP